MNKSLKFCICTVDAIVLLISLLVACGTFTLVSCMGHVNIEQILIHLQAAPLSLKRYVEMKHVFIVASCCFMTLVYWLSVVFLCIKKEKFSSIRRCCLVLPIVICCVVVIYFCTTTKAWDFIVNRNKISTMVDDNYHYANYKHFISPKTKKNLVVVFCESLEQTFSEEKRFKKNLIPRLTALQGKNLHFEKCVHVNGTNTTISSTSAVLYGMPRFLFGMEHDKGYFDVDLFSSSPSLLGLLLENGYKLCHFQGGDENFSGLKNLFTQYKDFELISLKDLKNDHDYQELVRKKKNFIWGVNDRIMLKHAREKMLQLASSPKPFCMTISTIDTHVEGYLEGINSRYSDYGEILAVQDKLLTDFVQWIQEQSFGRETTILMLGDHCTMRADICGVKTSSLSDGTWVLLRDDENIPQRTIFTCIINPVIHPPANTTERLFATFDLTPTIIHAIGFTWDSNHFGLGTSLFSDEKTLLEKYGIRQYETESRRYSRKYINILNGHFDE